MMRSRRHRKGSMRSLLTTGAESGRESADPLQQFLMRFADGALYTAPRWASNHLEPPRTTSGVARSRTEESPPPLTHPE
eukprot:984019-Prymnesium_polylepis.1